MRDIHGGELLGMTGARAHDGLLAFISRAGAGCRARVAAYLERVKPPLHFQQHVLLALSTLEHYSTETSLDETDLRLLARTTHEAAAVCRTAPPDEEVVALARQLEHIGRRCEQALAGPARRDDAGWRRFLFRDLDVEVRRDRHRWYARKGPEVADDRFLDAALTSVWSSRTRSDVDRVTIQILDWFERGES